MSRIESRNKARSIDTLKDTPSIWKQAISDAENKLEDAKKRVEDLKLALEIYRDKAASGEPWPGQFHGQKSEQQHSD